jgi:hypothetical protein
MFRVLVSIPRSNAKQLARFSKPVQFIRGIQLSTAIDHKDVSGFNECLEADIYKSKHYQTMLDRTDYEIKELYKHLDSPIKNSGGIALGVAIDLMGGVFCESLVGFSATALASIPFYSYAFWRKPKEDQLTALQYMQGKLYKKVTDEKENNIMELTYMKKKLIDKLTEERINKA